MLKRAMIVQKSVAKCYIFRGNLFGKHLSQQIADHQGKNGDISHKHHWRHGIGESSNGKYSDGDARRRLTAPYLNLA